jgi:hypothetical protein
VGSLGVDTSGVQMRAVGSFARLSRWTPPKPLPVY